MLAFPSLIGDRSQAYVPRELPSLETAIELIRAAGGVAVLAHPGPSHTNDEIPRMVDAGLQAIEVHSPKHSNKEIAAYRRLAEKYALACTAGSDCHGMEGKRRLLGTVRLAADELENLTKLASKDTRE